MYAAEYPILPKEIKIPYLLTGVGKCDAQCAISRPDGFCLHQIFYTRAGSGIIRCKSAEFAVSRGDIIILRKDMPYEYHPVSENWSTNWITAVGTQLDETLNDLRLYEPRVIHCESLEVIDDYFGKIMGLARSGGKLWSYPCSALIYGLLTEIYCIGCLERDTAEKKSDVTAEKIFRYIDANFSREITLEELACEAGVTPEHFCKQFRLKTNMRPFEYIARRRIKEAKLLLETTKMSVSEIGASVGYPDKSYFGYVFRKYEKISPTQFRG